MRIDQKPLTQIATTILHKAGAELKRAQAVAEHLVIANLKGHDSWRWHDPQLRQIHDERPDTPAK